MRPSILLLPVLFLIGFAHAATKPAAPHTAGQPTVRIDDVTRFYALYDKTDGKPSAELLQRDYLDAGSPGLQQFVTSRIFSAQKLADAISRSPQVFRNARACVPMLPAAREQLHSVFSRLTQLDPQAAFPPVTIVIGRNNTGGTTTADGVTIGLEVICRSDWLNPDIVQRLVHLIAHEYVHVQQPAARVDPPANATVLFGSLLEGGAEFIGELTSGEVLNIHLKRWTKGKACRIERDFQAHAMDTDMSAWLYNGAGTPEAPGDLGYWVGYRIARAYYAHASDKPRAIQDILNINNDNAADFLRRSGWRADQDCTAETAQPRRE